LVSGGDAVVEGQLLATLDSESLRLATEEARAQLAGARAKLVEAEQSQQRAGQLLAAGGISEADFEVSTSHLRSARASLRGAQSRVEQAERNRRRAELRAPFGGRIAARSVDPFQEIGADDSAFVLQGGDRLKVQLQVPDALIRNVDYGQSVRVSFPTDAEVELAGVVSLIGAQAVTGSGFEVEVQLPPGDADLRPGMSARVTFNFDEYLEGRDIYLIPLAAVAIDVGLLRDANRRDQLVPIFVFEEESGVVRIRDVRVLGLRGNQLEVYEGLAAGERVISAGVPFLRDGMEVELWSPELGLSDG
jgi:RND family efflux transporter MFP subunit